MKTLKYLLALIAVFTFVGLSHGDALTNDIVDGWYLTVVDTNIDTNGSFDTLAATDSVTILSNFDPKFGWEYILQRDAFTGTAADSSADDTVTVEVRVDCKDRHGNVYQYYVVDSMTAAVGESVLIPFGSLILGDKFDIKLRTYAGGTQLIINRLRLWRRRAQTTAKSSNF